MKLLVWIARFVQVFTGALLAVWLMACPILFITRDGLGPDSSPTHGWDAVVQFAPMLGIVALLVAFLWLARRVERARSSS